MAASRRTSEGDSLSGRMGSLMVAIQQRHKDVSSLGTHKHIWISWTLKNVQCGGVILKKIQYQKELSAWVPPQSMDPTRLLIILLKQNPNRQLGTAKCMDSVTYYAAAVAEREQQLLSFMQNNLHHCKSVATELILQVDIAHVQQPYIYKNKVTNGDKVRTFIIAKNKLNLIFHRNFQHHGGEIWIHSGRVLIFHSLYLPYELSDPRPRSREVALRAR